MTSIRAYHVPATVSSWTQIESVLLEPRFATDGRPEYRYAMYPILNCKEIETVQYKTQPGRIHRTCAFLICDESFSSRQTEENILLRKLGIPIKGSVLLVGGKRLEANKYLFNFDSLPDDYLATAEKLDRVLGLVACGWIMRNSSVPLPTRLTQTRGTQIFTPQEYAVEWHEQHKAIQREVLSHLLGDSALQDREYRMMTDAACSGCGKLDVKMKRCGACKITRYCSTACQKRDRRSHLAFCEEVARKE